MKNAGGFSLDTPFTQLILAYAAGGLPVWFLVFLFHQSLPPNRLTTVLALLLWLLFGFLMGVLFGNAGPVPKGEFKPVSFSDDHAVIAHRLLASVGMNPGDIQLTHDMRFNSFKMISRQNRPIVGPALAKLLDSTELSIVAARWFHTRRVRRWAWIGAFLFLGSVWGLGAASLCYGDEWGSKLGTGAWTIMLFLTIVMSYPDRRLVSSLSILGVPPVLVLRTLTKVEFIERTHWQLRTNDVLCQEETVLPNRSYLVYLSQGFRRLVQRVPWHSKPLSGVRDSATRLRRHLAVSTSARLQEMDSVVDWHRRGILNLAGQFGDRIRKLAEFAGIPQDRLRDIVAEAIADCEERLKSTPAPAAA